jgi:hypothetical protein
VTSERSGRNQIVLDGWRSRHTRLALGTYELVITARGTAGSLTATPLRFTII